MDIHSIRTSDTHQGGSFGKSIDLSGDARIPRHLVAEKSDKQRPPQNSITGSFAKPQQNIHRIGLNEGMQVADFGAGSGAYTLALAELVGPSGAVYAVDIQKDLLTRIQNNAVRSGYDTVHTVWGDIDAQGSVGIRDELLDAVLISNTFFQVEYKNTALKQAWRVLKPGGLLTIIDWTESYGGLGPQQKEIVSQAEAVLIATDNGFIFKREFDAGAHHYGIVFTKGVVYTTPTTAQENTTKTDVPDTRSPDNFVDKTISQELL